MDFSLTDTQLEFRDRARAVAEKLAPDYQARERAGRIEPELRREIGAAGLIAPEIPVALGGQGADRLTSGLVTEEIGRGDINVAYLQVVGSLVGQIVAANAAPEVAAHWVPKICSGEEIVGIGLTEPHAGSTRACPASRPSATGTTGSWAAASRCRSAATPPPWWWSPAPGRRNAAARTSVRSSCRSTCRGSPASRCPTWAPRPLAGAWPTWPTLPIEQRLRDVLGLQIDDGTAQIMKLIISRQKLGRELAP